MSPTLAWWLGAVVAAVSGLTLLMWALRGERSRGRKRCPKCWYDMSGTTTDGGDVRCPECGRAITRPRELLRPRRRWRWALLGLLLLTGGIPLGIVGEASRTSWEEVMPNTGLILIARWSDNGWAYQLLQTRMQAAANSTRFTSDGLWSWQRRLLERRCIEQYLGDSPVQFNSLFILKSMAVCDGSGNSRVRITSILRPKMRAGDVSSRMGATGLYIEVCPTVQSARVLVELIRDADQPFLELLQEAVRELASRRATPQLIDFFRSALRDSEPTVRLMALEGLHAATERDQRAIFTAAVLACLDDPEPMVRHRAILYTIGIGDERVWATLADRVRFLTGNEDREVSIAASNLLYRIEAWKTYNPEAKLP